MQYDAKHQPDDDLLDDPDAAPAATGQYQQFSFGSIREVSAPPNRHTVSASAVLSTAEVVSLLGGRASVMRQWLRRVRPLPHPSGRRVYLWSDVLTALKEAA